jgi:hypothetical protein
MNRNKEWNRILVSMLGSMLMLSAAYAKGPSDKTFLMPRDVQTNIAERHTTWHGMKYADYSDKKHFGARFNVNGFYYASDNQKAIGNYFGFFDDLTTQKVQNFIGVSADDVTMPLLPASIIHNAASGASENLRDEELHPLSDKISLHPEQRVWGARLAYYQNLDAILKGLFFHVTAPIAYVRNNIGFKSEGPNRTQGIHALTGTAVTFLDYLQGKVVQTANPNQQAALTAAQLKSGSDTATEVTDVRIELGYNFAQKKTHHVGLTAALSIPTGNTPKGQYLFEAVAGNGDHWEFGGVLDAHGTWKVKDCFSIALHGALNYMYVFEGTETRTLGIKSKNGAPVTYGHYLLAGQAGQAALFPLANVLTRDVNVHVGSKVDALASLAFHCGNFIFDLGYNLFYKDTETARVKSWTDDTYAIANTAFSTATVGGFDPTDATHAFNLGNATGETLAIQTADLDSGPASSASQVSHKLFGGLGYIWQKWSVPVMLGLGGSYEFAGRQGTLENWGVWAKFGVAV